MAPQNSGYPAPCDAAWRPLTQADVPAVAALETRLFTAEAWSADAIRAELTNPDRCYLGAFVDGEPVAYGGISLFPEADLMTIGVVPQWRTHGLGQEMLTRLLDAARAAGARTVFLEVRAGNAVAQHLYQKAGFRRVSVRRGYYQHPCEDGILMRLQWGSSDA